MTRFRLFAPVAIFGLLVLWVGTALAGTISQPTAPFIVPLNAAGTGPAPFKIVGTGYVPLTQGQVIICDGVPPTALGWDPTINCDNGTSPQNSTVQADGTVTWDPANINRRIGVFDGPSPSTSFNCYFPGETAFKNGAINPANGLPSWENCQVRVSTNNAAVTSDQAFVTITLPVIASQVTTTTTAPTTTTTTRAATTTTSTVRPTTTTTAPGSTTTTSTVNGSTTTTSTPTGTTTTSSLPGGTTTTRGTTTTSSTVRHSGTTPPSDRGLLALTGARIYGLVIIGVCLLIAGVVARLRTRT